MIRVLLVAVLFACGGSKPKPAPAPSPPPPDAAVVQPASGSGSAAVEIPAECKTYLAALDKLYTCPKLQPEQKDALGKAIEQMKAGLPDALASSPEARAQVIQACQQGGDAVAQAAKSAGC